MKLKMIATLSAFALLGAGLAACSVRGGGSADNQGSETEGMSTDDCVSYVASPGITDEEIRLGSSMPITGPLAAAGIVRQGIQARFSDVNEAGGIHGRQIRFDVLDDAYDPAKTVQNINRLLVQDEVFALTGVAGTATVLAYLDATEAECVPNLLISTGAPVFASPEYEWTFPAIPTYSVEGAALATAAISAGVKSVAILSQNDDFGKGYVESFTREIEGSGIEIVAEETYEFSDPTVDTQLTKLASSNADAILVAALGVKCIQTVNGIASTEWSPTIYVGQLCTARPLVESMEAGILPNLVSTAWFKDPSDPQWQEDASVQEFLEAVERYQPDADVSDLSVMQGWIIGQVMADFLQTAPELTRASVMETARNADIHVDTMLEGISYRVGPNDFAPIEAVQLVRYNPDADRFRGIDSITGEFLAPGEVDIVDLEGTSAERG